MGNRLNPFRVSRQESRAIVGKYVEKYRVLYTLLMALLAIFELALFIRGIIVFKHSSTRAIIYLSSYVFLFVFSLINGIFLFLGRFKKHTDLAYAIAIRIYAPAIILWSIVISYLDMGNGNAPLVYLTVMVTIGGMIVLTPHYYILLVLLSFGGIIGLDASQGFKYLISGAEYINLIIFLIMAILINVRHYIVSVKEYRETAILEEAVSNERNRVSQMSFQTILSISNAVDAKDKYTRVHSQRVAEYSKEIAIRLGWDEKQVKTIYEIALLHDIGKIGVPDEILNCPGELSEEQFALMKSHTIIGGEILKDLTILKGVDLGAKYHHERFDGTGYPCGLKGTDIPLEARIIAIADAFDAMNSNRIYRKRLTKERIIQELNDGRGTQFDPEILDAFMPYALKVLEEER